MTAVENPIALGPIDIEESDALPDDIRFWSVTEILKAIGDPGGLLHWSAEEAAKAAVTQRATWQAMEQESGTDEAIAWLTGARFRKPKGQVSAATLGNQVHDACEQYALTGERPDVEAEVVPYLEQFDRWLQRFTPSYQATEMAVFSPTWGYAGTCDAFLTIDGVRFCADYKSSRKSFQKNGTTPTKPYADSVGLQIAAYANADIAAVWRARRFEKSRKRYYLLSTAESDMAIEVPEVDMGLAVHITPDHCDAYPIPCGSDIHEMFLYAIEIAHWVFQQSKTVMGDPLVASERSVT